MASLFTPPYFDVGAGITPADGALLNFYVVGSGTRKNTFTTAAATTPHANPVVADTLGVFPAIYIQGENEWVLTDKNAVQKNTGLASEFITGSGQENNILKRDTIAIATADLTILVGNGVQTLGYETVGDGGSGLYKVVAAGTGTVDNGDYINSSPSGSFQLELVRNSKIIQVRKWGAVGENVSSDTTEIQAAVDAAPDYSEIEFPPGLYLHTARINFTGKLSLTVKGVRRASRVMFNHASAYGWDFYNPGPTSQGRAQTIDGMTFYSSFTESAIPDEAVAMNFCPETTIKGCTFIECAKVNQLRMRECWSSEISQQCFFSVDEPGLLSTYGSPRNSTATGVGLNIDTNSHAMKVNQNRIRTGYPSMIFAGGDVCSIAGNSIEGGKTNGLEIQNATSGLEISTNYFEGAQTWDIVYKPAGTNFGHFIHTNYHHTNNGIKVESGCDTNGLCISTNTFYSNGIGVQLESAIGFAGIKMTDNVFRDMVQSLNLTNAALKTAGLSYPANLIKYNNETVGTTPDKPGIFNTTLLDNVNPWATFSGTGTIGVSTALYSGMTMYEFTETSGGAGAYVASIDFDFDTSMQDEYITVNMPLNSTSGNVTVTIDDGVTTQAYTCNSGNIGALTVDSVFYFKLSSTADKIRVRLTVANTLVVQTLMPSVRIGLHDDLKYHNTEREKIKSDTVALTAIANAVNTSGKKVEGYRRYNITTDLFVIAAGNADGSVWVYEGTGATAHTPV